MSSVVSHKEPCPQCSRSGHGKSFVIYADGGAHCFECGYHLFSNGVEMETTIEKPDFNYIKGEYIDLVKRCISKETCEKYGYSVSRSKGNKVHVANYCNYEGALVAQKIRCANKEFFWTGEGKKANLFGSHLFQPNKNLFITITEGELDALSISEVQGCNYPVVSIAHGAGFLDPKKPKKEGELGKTAEEVRQHIQWLSGFKHIVLAFDMDEPGRKAALEVAELFEPGFVRIAEYPLKDANEMLKVGRGRELVNSLHTAKIAGMPGIMSIGELLDRGISTQQMGVSWPWKALTDITYGIREEGIYILAGAPMVGKSEVARDIYMHLATNEKQKVCVFAFETPDNSFILKSAGYLHRKQLHLPGVEFDEKEVNESLLEYRDSIYKFENKGINDLEYISKTITFANKVYGCKYVFIDPLTPMFAGSESERIQIDKVMNKLFSLSHSLHIVIFIGIHLNKKNENGKPFEQGGIVTPSVFNGSGSMNSFADIALGLERNIMSENDEEKNTLRVRVVKDRLAGQGTGKFVSLHYDVESGRLDEIAHVKYESKIPNRDEEIL